MSFWHLFVILLIVLLLFGAGKLPQVMADLAKGLKAFKDNLNDDSHVKPKQSNHAIAQGVADQSVNTTDTERTFAAGNSTQNTKITDSEQK